MTRESSAAILDPLRRLLSRKAGSSLPDEQLLENFVSRRDEPSFEVLVWRHGAMVLGLCQRVLRDAHEAEDAFQATFLVFARKAATIGRGEVVAAWLYKVAYRVALRLRDSAAKRASPGAATDALPAPEPTGDAEWHDLRPVLDDEIARLPEKYRAPFVLCYLEGRTNEEAATQLGCPKGTVLSRLSRGRERLRARLARRGVALTATAFALTLTQNAASASVSAALVSPTVGAALPFAAGRAAAELVPAHIAALTEGMLRTMTLFKAKIATAVLALAVLGSGIAWAARGAGDSQPRPEPAAAALPAPSPAPEPSAAPAEERDRERPPAPPAPAITGKVVAIAKDGKSFTVETPPTERGGEPVKTAVKFGEKVAVTYNGVGANGAAPTEGYQAQVWFEGNSKDTAATVVFNGPENARRGSDVFGTVVNGNDNKSITLELRQRVERGAELPKQTIPFDDKTVLVFSNVEKDGAKITAGYIGQVWYTDDGKTAAMVQLSGTVEARSREEKRPDAMGKVLSADGKALVVEVSAGRREEPTKTTYTIGDKTTMIYNNVPADGAKPTPGMLVQVWLADGSKDAAAKVYLTGTVPERWKTVSGKVVAVAKDGSSITVEVPSTTRREEPKRTEIKLTAKTKLAFFGVGPGEAKLAEGQTAQVRLLDGSTDTAGQITIAKPGERGR